MFHRAGSQLIRKTDLTILAVSFCIKLTANVLQMIVGMPVPHQTAGDGAQYAVSAKAISKDDHVSNNDVNKQHEDQEVCILCV